MNLNEFLEKFLPCYHRRDDVLRLDDLYKYFDCEMSYPALRSIKHDADVFNEFCELQDKLFAEALQNFADRICEKQRKSCNNGVSDSFMNEFDIPCELRENVLNAKQPKIEEL